MEILSREDDLRQTIRKAAHYLDWGIGHVWIIDPETRRAFLMSRANPVPQEIREDGILIAGRDIEISVSLSKLFREVDGMLQTG